MIYFQACSMLIYNLLIQGQVRGPGFGPVLQFGLRVIIVLNARIRIRLMSFNTSPVVQVLPH
jgi:hypothetical protein